MRLIMGSVEIFQEYSEFQDEPIKIGTLIIFSNGKTEVMRSRDTGPEKFKGYL